MTNLPKSQPLGRALLLLVLIGATISCLTFGIRSAFGLFALPVGEAHNFDREIFAFAVALQNLFWGLGQPISGIFVDKFGPARVLAISGLLYAIGVASMSYVSTPLGLNLGIGVLIGLGLSGCSFNTVLAAMSRIVPPHRRTWVIGVCTAAASSGQFVFAPLGQGFIANYGWMNAAMILATTMIAVPMLAMAFIGKGKGTQQSIGDERETSLNLTQAIKQAFQFKGYILLIIGFFVCGFQLAFITYHFPPYLADNGINPQIAGWAIGIIGLANIIGSYSSGILSAKFNKAYLLSIIYFLRAFITLIFLLLPLSIISIYTYAAAMGILWLSTVPPTSALVMSMFGTRYMATLYGFVFLNHQLGSFVGAWAGGYLFDRTGSYNAVWWGAIILSLLAAFLHFPIRETRAPQFAS